MAMCDCMSGRLLCEASYHLLGRAAAVHLLLEISERLDEKKRGDHGQKEIVQPHRLVHPQDCRNDLSKMRIRPAGILP